MDLQDQAQEFRHYFGVENSCDKRDMQLALIKEECEEFVEAHDFMFDTYDGEPKALKELADLVYVAFQYAENMEWDLMEAYRRVHQSNMSKLGEDKQPIRREDGKILKGPNYQPPDLDDLCHLIP
jgi:NTP pyrophosphatase (non-canonical NTP hydrolase)